MDEQEKTAAETAAAWDRELVMWEGIVRARLGPGAEERRVKHVARAVLLTASLESDEDRETVATLVRVAGEHAARVR